MKYLNQIISWLKNNASLFLSIFLLTMTVAIFGPLELYCTNYEEFWFTSKDAVRVVVILAGGCFIIFTAIGLLLRGKTREIYSGILFAIGLALYIQGNYVNIDYGVLNGQTIEWNAHPLYAVIDTLSWLILIVGAFVLLLYKQTMFCKIQKWVSLWIIVIQVVTLVVLFMTTDVSRIDKSDYYLSNEGIYEVSSGKNIIIFVLDGFDSSYFQEILDEDTSKYQTVFEDFTYFKNASAGACPTKLGMPAIITGEPYPGDVTYTEYIKQSFDKDKLYTMLQKQNYDMRIYSNSIFIPDQSSRLINNQVSTGYSVSSYSKLAQKYLSLTLYKYMPHILKRFFWIYTGDFEQFKVGNSAKEYSINDVIYFNGLKEEGLSVNQDKNIFRLFHLNGAHAPYTLDEYAQLVNTEDTSCIRQAKGALYIVESYISQLKELGLYDASTIVIMADHGSGNVPTLGAHGLLLVKEWGHRNTYVESEAPVSYYDLHATIFGALGISKKESFFTMSEDTRKRYFYLNATESGTMRVAEFVIDGNLNDENVLKATGTILQQSGVEEQQYIYGTDLNFGGDNSVQNYVCRGISFLGGVDFLWTDGKECEFKFEFENAPKKNLLVTLDILAAYSVNGPQKIIFYANDIECDRRVLSGRAQVQFVVPGSAINNDRELTLRMELPNAVSPAKLFGAGFDTRELALALRGLRIDETDEDNSYISIKPCEHYDFGQEGDVEEYLLDGWHGVESDHRWTSAQAELRCKTVKVCDYQLELHYADYTPSGNTNIYVNDTLIGTLDGNESIVKFKITADILRDDGNQVISFVTPAAISPKEAGENGDERVLGISVYSLDLSPVEQ